MTDDLITWLRSTITGDLDTARLIGAGGFEPQRWDTDPPGQVNPKPVPYRDGLNAVVIPDEEDRRDREGLPCWVEVVAWDRLNNEPPEADCRDSDLPVMLVDDGRREVDHIIRQDPRNTVARCEAELAILDEHGPLTGFVSFALCQRCGKDDEFGPFPYRFPCPTVHLLASGYRHRPGYREEWKP